MGLSSDLQRAIVARLKAAVPSVSGRVYDRRVAENAVMPYVKIGPVNGFDDAAECVDGQTLAVQIDIYAPSHPNSRAVNDATDEVRHALHQWADITSVTMHPAEVVMWDIGDDPDPDVLHGRVHIEVMLED